MHLTPRYDTKRRNLTSMNIRADLTKHFPDVRFSIRFVKSCLLVEWVEGPTSEAVDDIISKFQESYYDATTNSHVYRRTDFNLCFGGMPHVYGLRTNIAEHISEVVKPTEDRQRLALSMLAPAKLYKLISLNLEKFTVLESLPGYEAFRFMIEGASSQTRLHMIASFLDQSKTNAPIAEGKLPDDLCAAMDA